MKEQGKVIRMKDDGSYLTWLGTFEKGLTSADIITDNNELERRIANLKKKLIPCTLEVLPVAIDIGDPEQTILIGEGVGDADICL